MNIMKLISIKRETKPEGRFTRKMGSFTTNVTYIKKHFLNFVPIKTVHKYRETYYGKVKDCEECNLAK